MPVSPRTSWALAGRERKGRHSRDDDGGGAVVQSGRALHVSPDSQPDTGARPALATSGAPASFAAATARGTDRRSASMRSIRKKARSALPRSSRIAPRSSQGRSAPSFRQRSRVDSRNCCRSSASLESSAQRVPARADRPHRPGDLRRASRRPARWPTGENG